MKYTVYNYEDNEAVGTIELTDEQFSRYQQVAEQPQGLIRLGDPAAFEFYELDEEYQDLGERVTVYLAEYRKTQLLDIQATGGTNFQARLISDYDPEESPSSQDGDFLGAFDFGEIDDDGQYTGDDDDVIEHAREQFAVVSAVTAAVR